MPRRTPRNLRPDEVDLWNKVIEKAAPLHPERPNGEEKQSLARPKPHQAASRPAIPRFRVGETAKAGTVRHDIAPSIGDHVASQPITMDRKRYGQLKKGRVSPEARIDLHGMTTAQAHPALLGFIADSVAQGRRLVLVITGKGKSKPDQGPIPERHGVLRHQVPHWLNTPPLKRHVLQLAEAHLRHGGQGAYYVYLRRTR